MHVGHSLGAPMGRNCAGAWAWVAALLVLIVASPAQAGCADPFADPDDVVDFHLRLTSEQWTQLQTSPMQEPAMPTGDGGVSTPRAVDEKLASCDAQFPYFEVEFRCGTEAEWMRVGVRRKRDRTETLFKLPLKLDFNHYVRGQRWPASRGALGYRKLTLNSGQPDQALRTPAAGAQGVLSALLTEHLAWRVMREELPEAGGVAYATVELHFTDTQQTQYQGLYILIEDIDKTAIESRYGSADGAAFKTTRPECREEVVFDEQVPNSATLGFEQWLALDPAAFEGQWETLTRGALELDGLLRQEALRELLGNTDDTALGRMNNYFAVDLVGRRRLFLPWDLDDVFRPQPQAIEPETPLVTSCVGAPPCSPVPLGLNTRGNAEIRPAYLQAMCRLTNGPANETRLTEWIDAIDARIRPIVAREVPPLWEPRGLDPLDADTPGTYAAEVLRMQEWIPARIAAVRAMIEAEGIECPAGCSEGETAVCERYGCVSSRTCAGGQWQACVPPEMNVDGRDWDCDGTADHDSLAPIDAPPLQTAVGSPVVAPDQPAPPLPAPTSSGNVGAAPSASQGMPAAPGPVTSVESAAQPVPIPSQVVARDDDGAAIPSPAVPPGGVVNSAPDARCDCVAVGAGSSHGSRPGILGLGVCCVSLLLCRRQLRKRHAPRRDRRTRHL